jgi:hypothetical protein
MELTNAQKSKWRHLKADVLKRPFTAFGIGLLPADIDRLFYGALPTIRELDELGRRMEELKEKNVQRLRPTLTQVVGHRGSAQFAEKIGTDSMSIKYIIDNRYKKVPSHELIAKIEIYLNYLCDYEISLEYQNEARSYFLTKIEAMNLKANAIATDVNELPAMVIKLQPFDKKNTSYGYRDRWAIGGLFYKLDKSIAELQALRLELESVATNLIDSSLYDPIR